MAFITSDFLKESSTSTGTGNITLAGARTPGSTFASAIANGDTFHYAISHDTLNEWETGIGTMLTATTFSRSVLTSSNANAPVNFSGGSKRVDVVLPSTRIKQFVGPVQIGATSFGSGSLSFSDLNGVTWGLATNSNGGTITASVATSFTAAATREIGLVSHVGGNAVSSVSRLAFSNASNVTWSLSTAAGAATVLASVSAGVFTLVQFTDVTNVSGKTESSFALGSLQLPLHNTSLDSATSLMNVAFRIASSSLYPVAHINFRGGTLQANAQVLSFATTAGGVSFGLSTSNVAGLGRVAIATAVAPAAMGVVSHVGGNVVSSVTQLAFSDASNVTWSLSTAASAATVFASVAAGGGGGITAFPITNSVSSVNATILNVSNANGFAWLLSTGAGVATLSASYTVPSVAGLISAFNLTNAASSVAATRLELSNANGFSFLLSTAAGVGTLSGSFSSLSFSNLNGVTFGIAGSTLTASARPDIGVVSHIAGNVVSSVTQLAFSNASNVTFSLSTAANAATVIASVAAAGGLTYSGFSPHQLNELSINQVGQSSLHVQPLFEVPNFQHDRIVLPLFFTWNSTTASAGTLSLTVNIGVYSRNVSTLSTISTTTGTTSFQYSSSNGTANFMGVRNFSIPWTVTWPASNYWIGIISQTATAGMNSVSASQGVRSQFSSTLSGDLGAAANATKQMMLGLGIYTAQTAAMPATIAFSQINGTAPANMRGPFFHFASGTA